MSVTRRTLRLEADLAAQLRWAVDAQVRDLVDAWVAAWDEIAPDLTAVLLEMLVAGEGVTRAQMLRSQRLRGALDVIAAQLVELARVAGVRVTRDLHGVVDAAGGAQASIIDSQLPRNAWQLADLQMWSRVDERQIAAIVARSTQQITSRLRPLPADTLAVVRRELIRGLAAGANPRVTARRIVERSGQAFNGGLSRAMTIARTETLDAHRAAAQLGQAQHADVLKGWVWLASLSSRTCPACLAMHGTHHSLDEPGPEGHPACRCARMPETKSWNELGFDVPEPPPLVRDADEFFAGLSAAEQQAILGKRGYLAWLSGRYPREAWAVKKTARGWRDSWVTARPPAMGGPVRVRAGASPEVHAAAERILAQAQAAEAAVTVHVRAVAEALGGDLPRLESRFKTYESIVDKLTRPTVDSLSNAVAEFKDALRYTIVVDADRYVSAARRLQQLVLLGGYTFEKIPAGWGPGYKGLNFAIRAPDGQVFELQLHTPDSLAAAEAAHALYEHQRRLVEGSRLWRELQAEMDALFAAVPWPPGLPRID